MSGVKKYTQYIHMAVVFLLMFFFRYLPTFSTVTGEGMQVLGIFPLGIADVKSFRPYKPDPSVRFKP